LPANGGTSLDGGALRAEAKTIESGGLRRACLGRSVPAAQSEGKPAVAPREGKDGADDWLNGIDIIQSRQSD
jgi:hypothetical protein